MLEHMEPMDTGDGRPPISEKLDIQDLERERGIVDGTLSDDEDDIVGMQGWDNVAVMAGWDVCADAIEFLVIA